MKMSSGTIPIGHTSHITSLLSEIVLHSVFPFLFTIVPVLISVAFLTLLERKILASIQRRRGPSVTGLIGLLQPMADGLKLFAKESIIPSQSDRSIFLVAPILTLSLSLMSWSILPITGYFSPIMLNLGLLYIFAISSLSVYGIILAGWSSNSKYSFLGSLRSAAQMVSYEVSIGLILISLLITVGSLNLTEIIIFQRKMWFIFIFYPIFLMFFISSLAETNRPPFDLPEAEAELVSGYNVEYSAVGFAFFFIGEYANIMLMSSLSVIFFCGGWLLPSNSPYITHYVYYEVYYTYREVLEIAILIYQNLYCIIKTFDFSAHICYLSMNVPLEIDLYDSIDGNTTTIEISSTSFVLLQDIITNTVINCDTIEKVICLCYNYFYTMQFQEKLNILPPVILFAIKFVIFLYLFVCVRAALPRYRYDQLMKLGWKILLPLSLAWVFFISSILFTLNFLPLNIIF